MKKALSVILVILMLLSTMTSVSVTASSNPNSSNTVQIEGYPEINMNGHSDFVIYREGWRSNRIELALYNTSTNQPIVLRSSSLGFDDTSLYNDDEKYYVDAGSNSWVKFETGYMRISNHCNEIIASSRNVVDSNGNVVIKGHFEEVSSPTSQTPPSDAVEFNGHSYYLYETAKEWEDAKQYCELLGGHLATITSSEEQEFITQYLAQGNKNSYWIGGLLANNHWQWITGEEFSYTNWASKQPDNSIWSRPKGTEDCITIYNYPNYKAYSSERGSWNDLFHDGTCGTEDYWGINNLGFICEWEDSNSSESTNIRFDPDSGITAWDGETKGVMVILDSAKYDFNDVNISSSNPDVVNINRIGIGDGPYFPEGNEKVATVYLEFNDIGNAVLTATVPDGTTATLNVTVESKPADQKSIAILTTEKTLSLKTGDKMWLAFGLMDDVTQMLDGKWKKMAITNSDPTVVSLSDYSETEYGYSLELTGLKQGASHLTITDTETCINTIITISVFDQYVKSYSYAIDNVSTFYPNNKYEKHIATNIYDLNGLYVNNYNCKTTDNGYDISFDVYNSRYYSGTVDIYDATGTLINYEEIEKYSDISSLWDTGTQAYYLISDPITKNIFTYQQASFSKCTHIKFSVPNGGYFTISNNIAESPSVALLNSLEMLFDTTCDFFDLAISGAEKTTAFEDFRDSIKELTLKEISKRKKEVISKSITKEIKNIMKKLIKTDFNNRISMSDEVYSEMSTLAESILKSCDINWKHLFKSATGVGESYFTKFAGPAGVALKGCFAITKGSNKLQRANQMAASCNNTYATFYSNKNDCNVNQNGVIVNTKGNVDVEAVLQVFKVSNDDTVVSAIGSLFDKYELYNISFVKNDQLVQPSGKVTVRIPIPQGMKGNTCKVYRKENDNEWKILDAHIEGNYLVFETDHFSLYSVFGDTEDISIVSMPTKTDYFEGQMLDTTGLVLGINGEEVSDGYVCNPSVVTGTGTQTINVLYGNISTTFDVQVKQLIGDTNLDGSITISDVTEIQKYLAELIDFSDEQLLLADANGDEIISISDATHLQKYLAEYDVVLGKQTT